MKCRTETRHTTAIAPTTRLRDFDELAAFFSSWDGRFEQLSKGKFEGTLRSGRGRLIRAVSVEFNQMILARGAAAPGQCAIYTVTPENALGIWQGRRLEPGRIVVHGPGGSTDHRTARRCLSQGISLPTDELLRMARILAPAIGEYRLPSWEALCPPPEVAMNLNDRIQRFLDISDSDPAACESPEFHRFEQECIRAAIAGIFPRGFAKRNDRSPSARAILIRRADEFMRAHMGDPVGAIDLCAELGTSDRTLRLAFRERFGIGPMAYFRTLRLNAVRSILKGPSPAAIATAARNNGFHHLGNFAADYRRAFGERPSETRRGL